MEGVPSDNPVAAKKNEMMGNDSLHCHEACANPGEERTSVMQQSLSAESGEKAAVTELQVGF